MRWRSWFTPNFMSYTHLRGTLLYMRWFTEYDDFWFGCEWWWLLYWLYWWWGIWLFRYALWFIIWPCWLWRCPPKLVQSTLLTRLFLPVTMVLPWCKGCCCITGWCKSGWCSIGTPATLPPSVLPWLGFFWNDGTNSGASADNSESKLCKFEKIKISELISRESAAVRSWTGCCTLSVCIIFWFCFVVSVQWKSLWKDTMLYMYFACVPNHWQSTTAEYVIRKPNMKQMNYLNGRMNKSEPI